MVQIYQEFNHYSRVASPKWRHTKRLFQSTLSLSYHNESKSRREISCKGIRAFIPSRDSAWLGLHCRKTTRRIKDNISNFMTLISHPQLHAESPLTTICKLSVKDGWYTGRVPTSRVSLHEEHPRSTLANSGWKGWPRMWTGSEVRIRW